MGAGIAQSVYKRSYGLNGRGSIPGKATTFFFAPQRLRWLWGTLSFYNGYRGLSPWRQSGRDMKLATHLRLVPRSRMVELYFHSPIHPRGMLINHRDNFTLYMDRYLFAYETNFSLISTSNGSSPTPLWLHAAK
jgi:hypothetical protein